ncbi:ABC transporter permease [Clostridium sp. MSJ-4]|uniref:ABC transporter permease n=1 Tax=Clostridium simiarum TaxID=2841506 RepID=A0ABS6F3T5_9CLOT|nr:ABC transporter permease [Clostridium simiarum]MBU5592207.1 ABC transporter permease [Clostridium simiarum]
MSLFNIAMKNIKRNFYDYFLYFVSMAFSIMIYFTFTSIQYNKQIEGAMASKMISGPFKASSIVIAVFAAIFIWYSNSFFTRKRKQEIALYSMMGVKKNQIGRMLFYETLCMGIIALIVGILSGGLVSKLFMDILVKLMALDTIKVSFAIIPKAIIQTIIVFFILFLIASLHAYSIIYRFKLVDLFRAEQSGEKTPKASFIVAIISIVMIFLGYRFAQVDYMFKFFPISIFLVLGLTIGGSYLFFSSFVVFMVKASKRNKGRFYKGINMIGTSQLLFRIKGNARTLATIAVLSATTLTAVGTTYSFYYNNEITSKNSAPFSYSFITEDKNLTKAIEDTINKSEKNKLLASEFIELIKVNGEIPNLSKDKIVNTSSESIYVLSEEKYNALNKALERDKKISLGEDEGIYVSTQFMDKFLESPVDKTFKLISEKGNKDIKIKELSKESVINSELILFGEILVVNNKVYDELYKTNAKSPINLYRVDNEKDAKELSEKLSKLAPNRTDEEKALTGNPSKGYSEFYDGYRAGLEASGLMIFIGAFLGLVFLICTGSIIFFKQLSEATSDKSNYAILSKIGVNSKEMKTSIAKQLLTIFLLPLLLGLSHASFALKLLSEILNSNILIPVIISFGVYTAIYGIYYIVTVHSYYKIVREN